MTLYNEKCAHCGRYLLHGEEVTGLYAEGNFCSESCSIEMDLESLPEGFPHNSAESLREQARKIEEKRASLKRQRDDIYRHLALVLTHEFALEKQREAVEKIAEANTQEGQHSIYNRILALLDHYSPRSPEAITYELPEDYAEVSEALKTLVDARKAKRSYVWATPVYSKVAEVNS